MIPLWLFAALASARDVDGISFPEEATVGGTVLPLNGVGIRERFFFDAASLCEQIGLPHPDLMTALAPLRRA